jgi:hypothetical protein
VFQTEHVGRLIAHDEAAVGAFVPWKSDGFPKWACDPSTGFPPPDARGLILLRRIGAGFLCIRRDVLERMVAAYGPEISYYDHVTERLEYDLWPLGIHKGIYTTEDFNFCDRARELGYSIYGDSCVVLRHLGPAIYPLRSFSQTETAYCHELLVESGAQNNKTQDRERPSKGSSAARPLIKGE